MQRIFIIRHGQSTDNAQKTIGGQRDSTLTEIGKHQALMAGKKLTGHGIDLIVCSPLRRSILTAEIIAECIGYPPQKIKVMPNLVERAFGVLEGLPEGSGGSTEEVNSTVGVETLQHLQGKAHAILREITQDKTHKCVLLVCHSWIGRMLKVTANQLQPDAIYNIEPTMNASVDEIA